MEKPLLARTLTAVAAQYDLGADAISVAWREDGKPMVTGVTADVLDVSLSHEDRYCCCVCGPGPVGCDLAAITPRDRAGWIGLLGSARSALLESLVMDGDSLDQAGTRIWAATETLVKAGGPVNAPLTVSGRAETAVRFTTDDGIQILTLAIRLTWGVPLILAFTVNGEVVPRVPDDLLTADYPGYEPLYKTRPFEMIEGGPQGQLVFVQRLPVTFQPSANLSRTIYFANFIKWMGNTREASAWPVLARMSEQFASGRWGGVTNYGHLKILGEGRTSDQIEILMWVSDNSGPENSTMTLSYDFRRMLPGGRFQRLAFCRLQTTWVEILGPGVAKVAPYPAYYGQFIEDMCPRFDAPDTPEPMEESLAHLFDTEDDTPIYQAPSGPEVRPIVREQTFETTLAHANLVGNIYYANYYDWQGQVRDRFFYELIPDYYHGIGEKGELLTLESRVDHLREAMPFDRLVLTLAVKELRRCSVTFHVDYFRIEPDGSRVKIAYGMHRAVWVMRDRTGRAVAAPFPDRVWAAFETAIRRTSGG
ncbi:acyl-CoA thioesterase [Desulfosarcina cetonica]|uniref:acyl-CoA thioesterase n=1 Tax=Desulfosarcina cetonica TaxID=90730 RepID=UPI0006D23005|nr:acyl-CoA thioesterase [Desulfosarcina cetonica]